MGSRYNVLEIFHLLMQFYQKHYLHVFEQQTMHNRHLGQPKHGQKIVVKVPVNPMNVSVQLSYSWDGAGYNGVYKNVYGHIKL